MTNLEKVPPPTLITAREHLSEVVAELRRAPRLGIDIESNGFYAYREKVCLVQISSPSDDYVVDPIAIKDMSALGPVLADPRIEKVFHAGEYDILCLKRDYKFTFTNLFDTMIAGRLLGVKELGLAAAIERHFGVRLSKKLQRADWGRRPLSQEQIRYAQMDTHFLLRLSDIQRELLAKRGRAEDAVEAFAELCALEPATKVFDPEGYWRLAGRESLSGPQLACLKEIYLYREEQAASRDRALFRVMSDELMLRLAKALPASPRELEAVRGMTPYLIGKYGHGVLRCAQRGREAPPLREPPRAARARKDMREIRLYEELRQWRKARAEAEGVEPVVILSGSMLQEVARLATQKADDPLAPLSENKRRRYGDELLRLLNEKAGR